LDFTYPAEVLLDLTKSGDENENRVNIRIVANDTTKADKVNDRIVLKAFADARDDYVRDGIIDYDHVSVRGKTALEKAEAIVGEPTDLTIDTGLPVCTGFLFRGNPYVEKSILPALKSGSKVFGASVGGRILKKSEDFDPDTKQKVNRISQISLDHLALTPLSKAVSGHTSVELAKSLAGDTGLVEFSSFEEMSSWLSPVEEDELDKALVAGAGTDVAAIQGGQVLQSQSLEGVAEEDKAAWVDLLHAMATKSVEPRYDSIVGYLSNRGLGLRKAQAFALVAAKNVTKITNALEPILGR
jgi:hypothetical protein